MVNSLRWITHLLCIIGGSYKYLVNLMYSWVTLNSLLNLSLQKRLPCSLQSVLPTLCEMQLILAENHNFDFKEITRTNLVSVRFLVPLQSSPSTFLLSDLHTAAPHIFTRPWPNWFLFSFNIPPGACFLVRPLEQNFRKEERRKLVSSLRGEAQKSAERERKEAPLWGYRKVKIINVDSIEALCAHKGGKTLHFGSADPHSVINSFKKDEIKREQHESREGEKGLSVLQTGLAPARAFSPPAAPIPVQKSFKYLWTTLPLCHSLSLGTFLHLIIFFVDLCIKMSLLNSDVWKKKEALCTNSPRIILVFPLLLFQLVMQCFSSLGFP